MIYFCKKCTETHEEDKICPYIKRQIKDNPDLLGSAADFVNVAGQYQLVTSQGLDVVAQKINGVIGANLSFEGAHQFTRDIQVFQRLNVENFPIKGYFNSPEAAKNFIENATPKQIVNLKAQIVGAGGEVDWLRSKQGELRSIIEKSSLLNGNAPGVDGEVINLFNGKEITRVTVKAASTEGGIKVGTDGIIEALKKGTLSPDEAAYVTEGMKDRLLHDLDRNINHLKEVGDAESMKMAELLTKAKENLKITEHASVAEVAEAKDRIIDKIKDGKANTAITGGEVFNKAAQGAVIGAAVGMTISGVTNFIRYRNGELSRDEAFVNVGQDTTKSALMGGAMGAVTLFLPGGAVGVAAGFAIGTYINAALTNVLDEIFGKGAYRELLIASGCVMGVSMNLLEAMGSFAEDRKAIKESARRIERSQASIDAEQKKQAKLLEVL